MIATSNLCRHNKMKENVTHKKRRKSEHSKPSDHSDLKDSPHKTGGSKGSHHVHSPKKSEHGHDHDPDHHHHSASSHPFRPRRDTLGSRKDSHHERHSTHHHDKHSTHHAESVGTGELTTPLVFYENTYKMIPDSRFQEGAIKKIIKDVLEENLKETTYDASACSSKCKLLSEIIKERVKHLNMHRFKIISMVMISHAFDQSMLVTSRCLWDQRFDNSVSVEMKNGEILALGIVFAVYSE